jgi:putative ubiquitin-RnfH superfamily antitoxin RatB of RatAB toxin-antitoxin module
VSDFEIEVVFATSEKQSLETIVAAPGATVADVISMSNVLDPYPDQNRDDLAIGIWGRVVDEDQIVREGDRVELYRPLELDPREARRQLALVGRTMGKVETD